VAALKLPFVAEPGYSSRRDYGCNSWHHEQNEQKKYEEEKPGGYKVGHRTRDFVMTRQYRADSQVSAFRPWKTT
jgi:hypothetical protein